MSKEQEQSYHGNGKHEWEDVNPDTKPLMSRLRVPGGWLYALSEPGMAGHETTFVPMPEVVKHAV